MLFRSKLERVQWQSASSALCTKQKTHVAVFLPQSPLPLPLSLPLLLPRYLSRLPAPISPADQFGPGAMAVRLIRCTAGEGGGFSWPFNFTWEISRFKLTAEFPT